MARAFEAFGLPRPGAEEPEDDAQPAPGASASPIEEDTSRSGLR